MVKPVRLFVGSSSHLEAFGSARPSIHLGLWVSVDYGAWRWAVIHRRAVH